MKLESKYFDSIRIHKPTSVVKTKIIYCDWPECKETGDFPAPAGPRVRGKRHFCKSHIVDYNRNYNFFEGMSDDDIDAYRRGASTGHRPTWSLGARRAKGHSDMDWQVQDPLEIMGDVGPMAGEKKRKRNVSSGQIKALEALDLDEMADKSAVRQRYKALIKQYHPDSNGGDRRHETSLNRVLQAYQYLRASGFC
ncbi:J domain-containing protein [Alphaproteobacteria bacterium]|mgnify:FL=1|nr:J domain-containing protein [Alphaproteobacteria bacterium]